AVHNGGLHPPRLGIPAPAAPAAAVDPGRPLARAIKPAFESYGCPDAAWGTSRSDEERARQRVRVHAPAEGEIEQFLTRNSITGVLGPAPLNGGPVPRLPDSVDSLISLLDAKAGRHMACLVAIHKGEVKFLSARPVQATAAGELEAAV